LGTYSGIIPVDFAGRAVDAERCRRLADKFKLWIIEDACHAPGGYFIDRSGTNQRCGNGRFSDLSMFSFHPVKHIAAGEGGMITTNIKELYDKLLTLRTHGISRDQADFENTLSFAAADPSASEYPGWYMEMLFLGYNYRLTDFQAALGMSQLSRADENLTRRKQIAARYTHAFQTQNGILGYAGIVEGHAYHLYIIHVKNRLGLYNYLRQHKVLAQVHYIPTHLMPYYRKLGWNEGDFPFAEDYYKTCLSLPMYPTLTDREQDMVIREILTFLR
jgi:dTDP-4-amino-4,6-dideoxygalactose transaminase